MDGAKLMSEIINYEAEFCGRVPLNQTNLIQPHGVLLVVDQNDFRILQLSENAGDVFGVNFKEIVSKSLFDFMWRNHAERFKQRFEQKFAGKLPFTLSLAAGDFLASVQSNDQFLIVEIEKEKRSTANTDSFLDVYQELKYAMTAVEAATTTNEACEAAVKELKRISGFDKIMIYQFDPAWNGDVIAEMKEDDMESYLGLKFPASDIPKQARELYKKAAYRLIPNVEYSPVKLYPVLNPATNAFTDLSNSNLRSVAGVHLEYLRNMEVTASMSTRILVDDQLWGLIACHHRTPKYLSFEMCSVFELLSNVISAKIAAVQKQDVFSYKANMQNLYADFLEEVYKEDDLSGSFVKKEGDLLKLLNADGVAFVNNHQIVSIGKTPDDADVAELILWLQSKGGNGIYHQTSLSSVFEVSEKYASVASGILALPIQPERGSYILAFRPEAIQKVNWGGNPNEAVQFEADGKQYHPRNSFSQWQQTVKQTSLPWKPEEMEVAENFRNFVVEYTLNKIYS
jgi:light-regulated signal transduction histidine kinase (bacteriophytochrome)